MAQPSVWGCCQGARITAMSLYVETWIVRIMPGSQPAHVRDAAAMRSCGMGRSWAESHEHHPAQYLRLGDNAVMVGTDEGPRQSCSRGKAEHFKGGWPQQRNKRINSTVSFFLEGLRGRDCQGISLDNPLDTTMMVLSGVGSHYTGHGLKIPIPSCWHEKGFS